MDSIPALPFAKASPLWKSKNDFFRPFRSAASAAEDSIQPMYDPELSQVSEDAPDLRDLNTALLTLVDLFPDVEPEVFREMLTSVSEESRVQVVTEQMLQSQGDKRQLKVLRRRPPKKELRAVTNRTKLEGTRNSLPLEDMFRGEDYQDAVKQVFYTEFKNLSHSQIKAVMLETNYSYTQARPILQQLSSKSWRLSLPKFWPKRNRPAVIGSEHPNLHWEVHPDAAGGPTPAVRRTGSEQLDRELYELFVRPVRAQQKQDLLATDHALASFVNTQDAEQTGSLFDCECCYDSVSFEQIVVCDAECHQLCFNCVRRTVNEALYGQGWARVVDVERTTIRCFSPTAHDCHGCIPANTLRHILANGIDNEDIWHELQARMSREVLLKCPLPLQRCPFCDYAEITETPSPRLKSVRRIWQYGNGKPPAALQVMTVVFVTALVMFTVPMIVLISLSWFLARTVSAVAASIDASWSRIYNSRRGAKFTCRHPACSRVSCIRCNATWRDPHTCFENEKTSLRTAIEASATAAVKRTCPRCHLSFVKSSGCNKLVCNCGYTMCYICRQEITSSVGYAHFCQHFRPSGGRCGECERCDLYGDEDEAVAIRKAAEVAEKTWREQEGGKAKDNDPAAAERMVEALVGPRQSMRRWEGWLDLVVDALLE